MKKFMFMIIWLFILCLCSIESFSFGCRLDGTCFGKCLQEGFEANYCKLKCTTCGW